VYAQLQNDRISLRIGSSCQRGMEAPGDTCFVEHLAKKKLVSDGEVISLAI
jgi:hypothetical protein